MMGENMAFVFRPEKQPVAMALKQWQFVQNSRLRSASLPEVAHINSVSSSGIFTPQVGSVQTQTTTSGFRSSVDISRKLINMD